MKTFSAVVASPYPSFSLLKSVPGQFKQTEKVKKKKGKQGELGI